MKFPSIPHVPFSPAVLATDNVRDDKIAGDDWYVKLKKNGFKTTEKYDGGNIRLTSGSVYARSSTDLDTLDWIKAKHAAIAHLIPDNIVIYGEYLYAIHSISYEVYYNEDYRRYFFPFAIYDEDNDMWTAENIGYFVRNLGFEPVPTIGSLSKDYDNVPLFLERNLQSVFDNRQSSLGGEMEGFVIWSNGTFPTSEFDQHVFKWVRENHVQTDEHWSKNWKRQGT